MGRALVLGHGLFATRPRERLASAHTCVHPPTHASTTSWVLTALFEHAQWRQLHRQHHTGASGPFVHTHMLVPPLCTHPFAPVHFPALPFPSRPPERLGSSDLMNNRDREKLPISCYCSSINLSAIMFSNTKNSRINN